MYKIELEEEELNLINKALDIYSRIGILQFNYLTDVSSLQKLVWDKNLMKEFEDKAFELKSVFGYESNANPGIFNNKEVHDDVRVAAHLHQEIRHKLYLENKDPNKPEYTVNSHPVDICQIAGINIPNFKINKL